MKHGLVYAPAEEHLEPGHPENPGRMQAIHSLLDQEGVLNELEILEPVPATYDQLALVHDPEHIEHVERVALRGGGRFDPDTYCTAESYDLARIAAGTICELTNLILTGQVTSGIGLIRPPGHHAEINRAMGFCLFNNIAIAARHAQQNHNIERVLLIDFDVHHGNGTQDIFYNDKTVMFVSLHLFSPFFYPGTGAVNEIGGGEGRGYTINVPFGVGAGDYWYVRAFSELIRPLADRFQPELILVSAGFDAHWIDPLAAARLSLTGYFQITRLILEMAHELSQDRLMFCLEGGYHYEALSIGVLNVIRALLDIETPIDPLGYSSQPEADMTNLLSQLMKLHLPD